MWQLLAERALEVAADEQLDVLGRVLVLPRAGASDDDYRLRLKARLLVLRSCGGPEDIIAVFRVLFGAVEMTPTYPAAFILRVSEPTTESLAELYVDFLHDAKAAGVGAVLEWSPVADADTFSMEDGPGSGFGDATDPDVGGEFSGALEA